MTCRELHERIQGSDRPANGGSPGDQRQQVESGVRTAIALLVVTILSACQAGSAEEREAQRRAAEVQRAEQEAERARRKALALDTAKRAPLDAPRLTLSQWWPTIQRWEFETDEQHADRLAPLTGPGGLFYLDVNPLDIRNSMKDEIYLMHLCDGIQTIAKNAHSLWLEDQLQDYSWRGRSFFGLGAEMTVQGQEGYSYELGLRTTMRFAARGRSTVWGRRSTCSACRSSWSAPSRSATTSACCSASSSTRRTPTETGGKPSSPVVRRTAFRSRS
jgi:hypothetical protein